MMTIANTGRLAHPLSHHPLTSADFYEYCDMSCQATELSPIRNTTVDTDIATYPERFSGVLDV